MLEFVEANVVYEKKKNNLLGCPLMGVLCFAGLPVCAKERTGYLV